MKRIILLIILGLPLAFASAVIGFYFGQVSAQPDATARNLDENESKGTLEKLLYSDTQENLQPLVVGQSKVDKKALESESQKLRQRRERAIWFAWGMTNASGKDIDDGRP